MRKRALLGTLCVLLIAGGQVPGQVRGEDLPPAWAYPVNPPDFKPPPDDGKDWEELTPKSTARFVPKGIDRVAGPGEEFAEFRIDLQDCFEIRQPGGYRLQLLFNSRDGGFADGQSQERQFPLGPAAKDPKP